jgi:hypothetical protein
VRVISKKQVTKTESPSDEIHSQKPLPLKKSDS